MRHTQKKNVGYNLNTAVIENAISSSKQEGNYGLVLHECNDSMAAIRTATILTYIFYLAVNEDEKVFYPRYDIFVFVLPSSVLFIVNLEFLIFIFFFHSI